MTMTKAEIAEYVAQRKQAGLLIDLETAEVEWWWANEQDPYAIGEDPEEMGCSNRCHFVRAPGSDMWIYLDDLPEATIKVFRERWERERATYYEEVRKRERERDAIAARSHPWRSRR